MTRHSRSSVSNRIVASLAGLLLAGAAGAQVAAVGLSTVRAQRFDGDIAIDYPPQDGDFFAETLAAGDFDGDGADDLATGAPRDDGRAGATAEDAGLVLVRYGAARLALGSELVVLTQEILDGAEEGDAFGGALAACDFDGDGFDDLAVGSPGEGLGPGLDAAGAVWVFYGSSAGLADPAPQVFTQDTPGIPLAARAGDRFGDVLACGDFDGDGRADLAIGVPQENIADLQNSGAVVVLGGSPDGLSAAGSFELDQAQSLVTGEAEEQDRFGTALATGDFDADGFDELVVGAPGEDALQGAFHVFFGAASGLARTDDVYRDETGVGGEPAAGDRFAQALASGDFDDDGFDDLAIGVPFQDQDGAADCGQFAVLPGSPGGFDFDHPRLWLQNDILGAGASEPGEALGLSIAAGDFDRDGHEDLAVGSPGEFVTGPLDGIAIVLMGSQVGLSAARHRAIAAGLEGFPGDADQHERVFGITLAAGDFDGDGHADLAIGAPVEDVAGVVDLGTETVLYGALFADGFDSADPALWTAVVP